MWPSLGTGHVGPDLRTQAGQRLRGGLTPLQILKDLRLPRGQAEKGPGVGLHCPRRRFRHSIPLPASQPGLLRPPSRPGAPGPSSGPAGSWPRPAAWARAMTRKRSGSGSGVSAGRMAADTQVRRAAAGPTRPVTGCGRRPSSQTALAAGLGVLGGSGCGGRGPGAVSDRPLAALGPAWPARRTPIPDWRN